MRLRAGVLTADDINDYLGIAVATTALLVGICRYTLVLRGATKAKIDRATGYGFFIGLVASGAGLAALRIFS